MPVHLYASLSKKIISHRKIQYALPEVFQGRSMYIQQKGTLLQKSCFDVQLLTFDVADGNKDMAFIICEGVIAIDDANGV